MKIGTEVIVCPPNKYNEDGSIKTSQPKKMWVRELHNPKVAGLSHTPDSKHIYGILYSVIQPIN